MTTPSESLAIFAQRVQELEQVVRRMMRTIRHEGGDVFKLAEAHKLGYDALHGDIDVREEPIL